LPINLRIMDNLNDLKKIWLTTNTSSLPGPDEMVKFVKKYRNQKLVKKLALITVALLATATEIFFVFFYKSTMFTTRIGGGCIIAAGIILISTTINSFNRIYTLKDISNKDFIKFFEKTRQRQLFYHQKTQVVAFACCSAGLMLFLFEYVYRSTVLAVIAYAVLVAYLLVMWLIVRPRTFKKHSRKMEETMKKLEILSKQLN
jgi:hypothetical protein